MSTKKRFIYKASIGFSLAVIIGIAITVLSVSFGGEKDFLQDSVLSGRIKNDMTVLVIELLLVGLIGVVGMGGSVVYELESWSLLKATVVHFLCTIGVYILVGITLGWLSPKMGIWNYIQILAYMVAYALIWMIQSMIYKKEIRDINRGVELLKRRENTAAGE
ncbi:MAG: DUF3021 domain-containing protein [Eubacterium sp.]|nr:DUF3021 domain-containing protein [Eubacterium sp.]